MIRHPILNMNGFQKTSITPSHQAEKPAHKAGLWVKSHILLTLALVVFGFFILKGVAGALKVGQPFSIKQIVLSAVSDGLKEDESGHTNILLLGVGGEGHEGADLTDTIIVASVDLRNKRVAMLSIPRDLYVENQAVGWGARINSIYENLTDEGQTPEFAMNELINQVESVVGVDIHYYAKVDFHGFSQVVDALGGVTVNVQSPIADLTYPAPDGSRAVYEPFYLQAGVQDLDGETALKYARSRHTTSDFDRARRQQELIEAIKDKALNLGLLFKPSQIESLLSAISDNFETDMTLTEALRLADFAKKLEPGAISSQVISDGANLPGGFLYTPEREAYGGAFVLIPYVEDFSEIQRFAQLYFYHPEILDSQIPIQVLNGTKREGLAGLTKMMLVRYGFNVVDFGNGATIPTPQTRLITFPPMEGASEPDPEVLQKNLDLIESLIPVATPSTEVPSEYDPAVWETDGKILIELGEDFESFYDENKKYFYLGFY